TVVLFAVVLIYTGGTAHSAAVDLKDGEWEVISETSMTMGTMSMPSTTSKVTHCLTRDDTIPASEKQKDCKVVDQKVVGNTVSWRVVCKDGEGEGEITYRGTTYNGTFRMKMAEGGEATKKRTSRKKTAEDGETMTMNVKLSGKHLGPCPKGQKSGPTGETAKQIAQGQAMAESAQAQAKQRQAEMEAQRLKAEALIKRSVVPADAPGACEQEGFEWTEVCEQKAGKLNLQDGEYEVTIEEASRIGPNSFLSEVKKKTVSLGENAPVPPELLTGQKARMVKRGKDKITWRVSGEGMETKGGVSYSGSSFEGVVTTKTFAANGIEQFQVKNVTGQRIGDAKYPVGRHYSPKRKDDKTGAIPDNPLKNIRKRFGF
ncbi:MAG: DUF3617 domain-containing protein, partial [Candidatus Deferrimicrobiaceae bacterium]